MWILILQTATQGGVREWICTCCLCTLTTHGSSDATSDLWVLKSSDRKSCQRGERSKRAISLGCSLCPSVLCVWCVLQVLSFRTWLRTRSISYFVFFHCFPLLWSVILPCISLILVFSGLTLLNLASWKFDIDFVAGTMTILTTEAFTKLAMAL